MNNGIWGREFYGFKETDLGYLELAPGSYVLRIKVRWRDEDKGKYTVVVNSEKPLTLTHAKREKYKDFLKNFFLEKVLASATAGDEIGESHLDNEKQIISILLFKYEFSCIITK